MEVIWWTFFLMFVFILGVLGKRPLNPEVLKCHEDLITLDTYMYNKEKQWITRQSEMAFSTFDTNPESLRPFVPEIWPNNVFNLSATYDLDLWSKIFVSHGVPIRNMYAKFHNDRLRNGWDITLWNFAKTRTNKQTHTQTNTQTNKQTWALQYLALPLWGAK